MSNPLDPQYKFLGESKVENKKINQEKRKITETTPLNFGNCIKSLDDLHGNGFESQKKEEVQSSIIDHKNENILENYKEFLIPNPK